MVGEKRAGSDSWMHRTVKAKIVIAIDGKTRFHVPAARSARALQKIFRPIEGAGKAGCPLHPQPVCIGSKHTVVTTSTPEITRLSPRNGFNGFLRALPGDEFLFVTVASWITICPSPVGPTHLREA